MSPIPLFIDFSYEFSNLLLFCIIRIGNYYHDFYSFVGFFRNNIMLSFFSFSILPLILHRSVLRSQFVSAFHVLCSDSNSKINSIGLYINTLLTNLGLLFFVIVKILE